jgi:hypothetical protein
MIQEFTNFGSISNYFYWNFFSLKKCCQILNGQNRVDTWKCVLNQSSFRENRHGKQFLSFSWIILGPSNNFQARVLAIHQHGEYIPANRIPPQRMPSKNYFFICLTENWDFSSRIDYKFSIRIKFEHYRGQSSHLDLFFLILSKWQQAYAWDRCLFGKCGDVQSWFSELVWLDLTLTNLNRPLQLLFH